MKTFSQFIAEAEKPRPTQKMVDQIEKHLSYAGWVQGYDEADRWNKSKKRTASANEISDRARQRARGIQNVLLGKPPKG
jgi:hypothetical protein